MTAHNLEIRSLRRERQRWDEGDRLPMALGCVGCIDRDICGGMRQLLDSFSCFDDCCGEPKSCDSMCPRNEQGFIDRMREIDGLELDNLPRATPCAAIGLPKYVPYIYHGSRRSKPLDIAAVALPLRRFFRHRNGKIAFSSRADIEAAFGIAARTRIVLVGSGRDKPIEAWWGLSEKRALILAELRALGVSLVTGPNYSIFTDEIRYSDMYNMKRIGVAWQEIVASGLPGAYHLNARTPHDYHRLTALIAERDEITEVAFEFKTGAAWRQRLNFHLKELVRLARGVGRPLHLIMIGGIIAIPKLAPAFATITYIDSSAFMGTLYRQRLNVTNERKIKKTPEFMLTGQPVDGLLIENIAVMRTHVEELINAARSKTGS